MDYFNKSLIIHEQLRGKISVECKLRVETKDDLSVVYAPGVAAPCEAIAADPSKARSLTIKHNTVAVLTDGSAVLGLGNIGPLAAIPVMEGKAMLFKQFAGIDAWPICLDTQDTEEIIRTVKILAPVFGGINLEDISAPRCFEIEARLKKELTIPVFHDDQHGTALVVLAGLLNALKVVRKKLVSAHIVISGAGAAGQAITELLLKAGAQHIIVLDSKGIISRDRKDLDHHKKNLLKVINKTHRRGSLSDALVKADVFIGVSKAGLLQVEDIKKMSAQPIIFALANPVPEIMPEIAKKAGAAVVATGRSDFPNQLNNSLGFPGIFRGALDNGVRHISEEMLIRAAYNLAALIAKPTAKKIIPTMFDKRIVAAVAKAMY